jgi:hypothetical protein
VVDSDVLAGRNPAWREVWDDQLTDSERRDLRRAVMRGGHLDDEELMPFLVGLLARERRSLRWKPLPLLGIAALWLVAAALAKSSGVRWFFLLAGSLYILGVGASLWVQRRWLDRSERLNLRRR